MGKNENYNFSSIFANIDQVKKMKASKQKKPSVSIKPLKFDPSPDDSPIKAEIVRRINEKNLTYSDIYAYCTNLKNGDSAEGQKLGYNIISGLKNRHSFTDPTLTLLADFLNLDILFVEREEIEKANEDDNSEI